MLSEAMNQNNCEIKVKTNVSSHVTLTLTQKDNHVIFTVNN